GHLWVVYFMMAGYRMLVSVELENGVPLDTQMIYALGGNDPFICADTFGAVWVLWTRYGDQLPVVSWSDGHGWSSPERAGSGDGPAKGLLPVDRCGGIIVLFQSSDGHYYSTVGAPMPGVAEKRPTAHSRQPTATVVRGVLIWSATTPSLRNVGDIALHSSAKMLDASGRVVAELQPGENDIRHLAPGIYFVRSAEGGDAHAGGEATRSAVSKIVVQR
ncbi:MAG: hypothetical protein JSU73_13375, partial [candidate division WOR-3 bacterium]